jgi:hypothetical protein
VHLKRAPAAEYGPSVLPRPDNEGFNIAAYLVLALAILAASGGIALAIARWRLERRRTGGSDVAPDDLPALDDAAELARLETELKARDG